MTKAAILVLAGTESAADLGRITNALQTAKEFDEHDDEYVVLFDGAATQWVAELEDEEHKLHALYRSVKDDISVCDFCVGAYEQDDAVDASGIERSDEYEGHPSIRSLAADGYEIITF